MFEITVDSQTFEVEFRHRRKNLKSRARSELYAKSPVRALTQCVIRGVNSNGKPYYALGSSVCIEPDNFSRPIGRYQAFHDAIKKCGLLRPVEQDLYDKMAYRFPVTMKPVGEKLPVSRQLQLRSDGQEKRLIRQQIKEGAVVTPEQYALIKPQTKRAGGA